MAGSVFIGDTTAYLSRMMGEPVSAGQIVRLRSVHRAALSSWARKQNIPLNLTMLGSGQAFAVQDLLLDGQSSPAQSDSDAPAPAAAASPALSVAAGIGIDIEEVEALPLADDYREHPFFRDNFTSAEIAYCVRQGDVRASFCGTWAAKEAVIKSGMVTSSLGNLRSIEISRDAVGRPRADGCQLSISHTAKTAIAVCIVAVTVSPLLPQSQPGQASAGAPLAKDRPQVKHNKRAAVAAAVMLAAVLVITLAWRNWAA